MAAVEQQIAVRIKNFVEGLPQVQALSAAVQSLSKVNGSSGLKTTAAQVVNLGTVSDKTVKNLSGLFSGFQSVSKGFANGSTGIKSFTGDLGVAAREMKAITDQSRLLGPAGSIQLPARSPVFETLKPLVEGEAVVDRTVNSLRTEAETVGRVATNAERLAEAWQAGSAAVKKQVEGLAALNAETNTAFKNIIGGSGKASSGTNASSAAGGVPPKKPVEDLNEEVDKTPGKVSKATNAFENFFSRLGRIIAISALFAIFYKILNTVEDAIHRVEEAVKSFIVEGIRYNASLETSKISLASLIAQTSDIKDSQGNLVTGAEKFAAAEQIAGQEMSKVQAIALETRFHFEDILQAVTLATAAVGGTNVTISQTLSIVEKLARAAGALKLNPTQFQTQVRQILTGATRIQTVLATALFPGQSTAAINKQIKGWRDAGTLVDELNKKLAVFSLSAKEVESTFDALASNVQDAFSKFAGQSTSKLFDDIKAGLKFVLAQIVTIDDKGVHLTPTFQKFADMLNTILGEIGTVLLGQIKQVGVGFSEWVKGLNLSTPALKQMGDDIVSIAENLGGMVVDIVKYFNFMLTAGEATSDTLTFTHTLAIVVGGIRDVLRVIYGILELIQATVLAILTVPLLGITIIADIITGKIDAISQHAQAAYNELKRLFSFGLSDVGQGVSGADRPGQHTTKPELGGSVTGVFDAFPTKVASDQKAASDRAKRDQISTLKALNEAALELYLQNSKNEVDVKKLANEEILKNDERRFQQGLLASKGFYAEKERLTLANIAKEEEYKQKELDAEKDKLRLNLAALENQADISDAHFRDLLNRFNSTDRNNIDPKDTLFNKQIVEFLKFQKSAAGIQGELNSLADQRKQAQDDLNNSTVDTVRLNQQLGEDIKGQLADALGAAGVSDEINLEKRISDELPKLLNEFGQGIPGLQEVSQIVHDLGDVTLDQLLKAFDLFNVDVDNLPEPIKNVIKLFKELQVATTLSQSSGRANSLTESLKFDLEGIQTGLEKGDIGVSAAVAQAGAIKRKAVQDLTTEYNIQKAALDALPPAVKPEEIVDLNRKTQAVGALGRAIEALGNGTDELSLITADSQKAQDQYSAKLDAIAIKVRNFSISGVEATKEEIAAKKILIAQLQEELALAEQANQAFPENAKRVADLINQIGVLQNETHAQTLDLAHGIEDSIGGAFSNFFDAIQQGNESIVTSFRRVISQMLAEIAKLIFQAYVLKSIMAGINSVIGSFGGGASAAGGAGAGIFGGPLGSVGNGLAEGGIISGPGTGVSDSIPAMLSHGEAVIPARSVNAYGRGLIQSLISGSFIPMRGFARFAEGGFVGNGRGTSGGGQKGTRIVNIIDKSLVSDYLNSSEGEDIVLNIIGRNPGVIQRLA